ncbi:hypothetical protein LWC08_00970 [Desulfobaculum bizertense]|nr:hypothetical protein LWC08_00970 [Desulfobaculum bizertense]
MENEKALLQRRDALQKRKKRGAHMTCAVHVSASEFLVGKTPVIPARKT